jgi:hypothetical protein
VSILEDTVELILFFDALEAAKAFECLKAAGVPFALEDYSERRQGLRDFQAMPAIQMEFRVRPEDLERAKVCLRDGMRLFPLPEVVEDSEQSFDDDEVLSEALVCDELSDSEEARTALTHAGIWSSVRRNVDDEDGCVSYCVEVKGKDIEKAVIVMNKWLESR